MDKEQIELATKTKLVNALYACPAMRNPQTRNRVVDKLTEVRGIPRSETDRVDIANILDRSLDFEGGLAQLRQVLHFYEGESIHMQRVDALVREQGVEVGTGQPIALRMQRLWPFISLLLVGLLIFISWAVWTRFEVGDIFTLPVAEEGETLILVTNFYLAEGIDDAEPHDKIVEAIQSQIDEHDLKNVQVIYEGERILRKNQREEARKLAEKYNASIIIWGDETSTDITVKFLNLRQPDYAISYVTIEADNRSVHKAALANPEPYIDFVSEDLPAQLTFLALFALAQSEYNQQKYENAIALCELAEAFRKEAQIEGLSEVYLYLGWLYQTLTGDSSQSIRYYDKAIELDTEFVAAINNRGMAYRSQGKYEQALADFDRAIALNPDRAVGYNNRGIVHELLENVAESVMDFQQYVERVFADPVAGATYISAVDGAIYRYVPAGDFIMGSSDEQVDYAIELCATYRDVCQREWYTDEQPQHMVYLDGYWIMETEVTNAQYRHFIEAGGYTIEAYWSPEGWSWRDTNTEPACWDDNNYNGEEQPVACITWYEAEAYANWISMVSGLDFGLPTEAQWEKAARGTDDRNFPWGNEWDEKRLNYCDKNCPFDVDWIDEESDDGYGYAAPVGSYPMGASPYGALDMAGNVWEWTSDWYDLEYYNDLYSENPTGPEGEERRVLRGGSWFNSPYNLRATYRHRNDPDNRNNAVGFRLRLSVSPGF